MLSASRRGAGTYELVAGTRRYRASKLAKRETIPATVRELTDAQSTRAAVIENVQRVDVHPLDEAQDTRPHRTSTRHLHRRKHFIASLAVARVRQRRLRLIHLIPEVSKLSMRTS